MNNEIKFKVSVTFYDELDNQIKEKLAEEIEGLIERTIEEEYNCYAGCVEYE